MAHFMGIEWHTIWAFCGHGMAHDMGIWEHGRHILWAFYGHSMAHDMGIWEHGRHILWAFYGHSMAHDMGILWAWKAHRMGTGLRLRHTGIGWLVTGSMPCHKDFDTRIFCCKKFLLRLLKRESPEGERLWSTLVMNKLAQRFVRYY